MHDRASLTAVAYASVALTRVVRVRVREAEVEDGEVQETVIRIQQSTADQRQTLFWGWLHPSHDKV